MQRSGGSGGRGTPGSATPRAALQTPAPAGSADARGGGTGDSPALSVPRLRRAAAGNGAQAALARGEAAQEDEATAHVAVRGPQPPTPWRIRGAVVKEEEPEAAQQPAEAEERQQRRTTRTAPKNGKKRKKAGG